MLISIYYVLKDKVEYKDLGGDYLNKLRNESQVNRYIKKLTEAGYEISLSKKVA